MTPCIQQETTMPVFTGTITQDKLPAGVTSQSASTIPPTPPVKSNSTPAATKGTKVNGLVF